VRGDSTWTPVPRITDALDAAFYASFGNVEPAGKRTMLALDVSGSMGWTAAGNLPLTCREASAAMAMVTVATEPETATVGFTSGHRGSGLTQLDLSPRRRLDDVIRSISDLPFGGTDCALPIMVALQNAIEVDTFVVFTDNETWAGSIHPHQALRRYRESTGIDARLIVAGMAANEFTIADPSDPGMLDIAGMDSAVPTMIADFSRGSF
jgi:60 kDa SS-A/Ro ribonucleoprotein